MAKNNDLKAIYEYLSEKYTTWYCSSTKAEKARIERSVYNYLDNIDDSLYIEMNDGRASGLCGSQFFRDDILRCLNILEEKLKTHH